MSVMNGKITAANGDEIHTYVESAWQDLETEIWYFHYIIMVVPGDLMAPKEKSICSARSIWQTLYGQWKVKAL